MGNPYTPLFRDRIPLEQCALTKLSYLLSKPELSVKEVRDLIGTPLRGELTRASGSAPPSQPTIEQNLENIQSVLSRFVRLSRPTSHLPQIVVSNTSSPSLDEAATDAAAPWSWTAAEAATTEAVLFPFLIHLAAARDDTESIAFCLGLGVDETGSPAPPSSNPVLAESQYVHIAGGVVNCLEPASGRSPLHVAALNGNVKSVNLLLRSGALVHLRDTLGHTALYYVRASLSCSPIFAPDCLSINVFVAWATQAARQGHTDIVDELVQAGATLAGFDGGFVAHAINNARRAGDTAALRMWGKTGVKLQDFRR